jgi:hypothetical protein
VTPHGVRSWRSWLPAAAWLVLLGALPWWLGLPLLLAMAAVLLISAERLGAQQERWRRGLRWGLPGLVFTVQRGLGGDALAWAVALVGALVGFTVLAGLESWLDRARPRPSALRPVPSPGWPELARAPIGPAAAIIELQPPHWCDAATGMVDPRGGGVRWRDEGTNAGRYRFGDGREVAAAGPQCCFSPDGRWFAAPLAGRRGVVLLDREQDRLHRLRGWQLYGWHAGQPWLVRGERQPPVSLRDALGHASAGRVRSSRHDEG